MEQKVRVNIRYREVFNENEGTETEKKLAKEANELFAMLFGEIMSVTDVVDSQEN